MHDDLLIEMQSYVDFSEADAEALRELWPVVEPHLPRIIDDFYARIQRFPTANAVFSGPEQVERLKRSMAGWMRELLVGPHDRAYLERRRRIGQRHVDVRLPHQYMFTAMTVLNNHLSAVAQRELPADRAERVLAALQRATTLDLAMMTGAFMSGREREQAASLQELIVSRLPVTIMLVGADRLVRAATPSGFRALGITGALEGRPFTEVLPDELVSAANLEAEMSRACHRREVVHLNRVTATLDGRERTFALHILPLEDELGGCLLHVEESTAMLEAEARVHQSEALARIGELSAAVAHELRNPLAGISGAIQVISRGLPADDSRRGILDKVITQIARLNRLVRDLLDFAHPKTPPRLWVDLAAISRSATDLLRTEHPQVQISVHGNGRAMADADQVHRTVLNLIENAAQATHGRGTVEVTVGAGFVRVADDGPGVPPEMAQKIFEPFVTTKTQGTGLGLAICRNNARSLGGNLVLEPTERGASFLFTLPAVPDERAGGSFG